MTMPVLFYGTSQTAKTAFDQLLRRIELNPTRVKDASTRYLAVKQVIESALPGKTMKQIGFFQRKTKLRPVDLSDALDLDTIVDFGETGPIRPYGGGGTTPQMAIEVVRRALVSNETYRVMAPVPDSPVVVLEYADKLKIEIAPVFTDKTGARAHREGLPSAYLVPGKYGQWDPADYDYDALYISAMNEKAKGALVPTIKIAKAFLRNRTLLKSFHIEILAGLTVPDMVAHWESSNTPWGYPQLFAAFLGLASERLMNRVSLPGSYSPPVDSDLALMPSLMLGTMMRQWSEQAWQICNITEDARALAEWRRFYGEPFPASI